MFSQQFEAFFFILPNSFICFLWDGEYIHIAIVISLLREQHNVYNSK